MKIITASASLLVSFILPLNAFASSCENYGYKIGAFVTSQEKGPKIISTYQVAVEFDDRDEVNDAWEEAETEAKAQISEFMNTTISKECQRKNEKLSTTLMSKDSSGNQSKSVNSQKIKTTLCNSIERTQAVLKGVAYVGRCYSKGDGFVNYTVGIKPETILNANRLNQNMRNNGNESGSSSNNSGFNPMDGYSHYDSNF
tara:strand:+ start:1110 stop:1709 length:600 start_codon:yes stop_codon:yes gene_type:complete